ncbi:Beta-galactosidase-1-like protein 2 [Mactra antiquata]
MAGKEMLRSKTGIVAAIIVIVLLIASIALPVYISTLDSTEGEATRTSNVEPSHTEAYVSGGSLTFQNGLFYLNGTSLRIVSGALHYFRTPSEYWNDQLQKLKACGMNTVETYVPWNQHEEYENQYNFDDILDLRKFIQLAHGLGLYVIFRPGPYICSEWDFGGLPSWLLRDPDMKVRSNYPGYTKAVEKYFDKLLPMVVDLQYHKGGPIIAFQIENEFGSYDSDIQHLLFLKQQYIKHGLNELYLTSDNIWGVKNDVFYQHAMPTANFKSFDEGRQIFDLIEEWSSDFPLMVTEFWTGWFDHWGSEHEGLPVEEYEVYLRKILEVNASINFYMFHGGSNFGFMNGANKENQQYKPDVSNYDYDALLSENGDITPKYLKTRELLLEYVYKPQGITTLPDVPSNTPVKAYGPVTATQYLPLKLLLDTTQFVNSSKAVPMEMLKLPGDRGQNFGYVLYRCDIQADGKNLTFENLPTDRAQIFQDNIKIGTLDWKSDTLQIQLSTDVSKNISQLDILVENHGRVNYATLASGTLNTERKGINGNVFIDDKPLTDFKIYPLEFQPDVVNRSDWMPLPDKPSVPALFKATLTIEGDVNDSFVYMKGWGKGIIFVNGFNLGRYWIIGPQQTLYVPAPKLRTGDNQIVIFEQETVGESIIFTDKPIYDVNDVSTIDL